ncbi:hypothetical protein AVEN_231333-1 [Araneus ventricosus]|uniref:Major facilitator superfamily associated domain-containing protein n=1 Tax=Araneus ventricosus TaxID=182803 RepID=A0A4Y2CHH8_ARAVE|nr:hypothetical protein AVEN_231333-1 [Araneus ventricosus]
MDQKKKFYHVSKKLLPVKLHFLVLFAGYGGVKPFQSLIGKGLNISATAVGFTNTTLMGLTLLCKPLIGSMVDYFRNIRVFLICLVLVNAFSTLSLLLLPPIKERTQEPVHMRLQLTNSSQAILVPLPVSFDDVCVKGMAGNSEINCNIIQVGNTSKTWDKDEIQLDSFQNIDLHIVSISNKLNATFAMHLHSKEPKIANFTNLNQSHILHLKCEPDVHLCKIQVSTSANEYETYQFWAFACIVIIAGLASGNINSLSDVACYEVLGEQRHLYGRQRLFGTIGWSLSCLLSGYLSDLATGDSSGKDYSPGFYLMLCLMLTDTFILSKMPLNKELKLSTNIYKDVRKVFHSSAVVLFAVGSVLIGSLTAAIAYYELWYLQDLGASQSLLGWTIIIQCLVAEMPFFIISGWFVKKFGSFNCLIGSFAAYALRFGCYSIITNPWWALLIATTHGFTFAIFQAAMTNFVSVNAPEGVEGTMFGIFGGLIDGMGQASGSLLCGAAFDKLGGRLTYTIASIFSGACAVAFLILSRLITRRSNRTREYTFESISLKKQDP